MIRSPQHIAHAGKYPVWKFQISGNWNEMAVLPEVHEQLLRTNAAEQQTLLVQHYHQRQAATTTEPPATTTTTNTMLPNHSTPKAGGAVSGMPSHTQQPLQPEQLVFGNDLLGSPHHQNEADDEAELRAIAERTAEIEETLNKSMTTPFAKTPAESQDHDIENWTYSAAEEQKIEEKRVEIACHNRQHEFEKRTKQYLAAPAKRFVKAYRTCIYHFERNADQHISKEYGHQIMAELVQFFQEMEEAREYCMEVLSTEDKLHNPRYEEYMEVKLDQLNECRRLHDQYFQGYHQGSQILQQLQNHEDEHQAEPKVPQPTGEPRPHYQARQERLEEMTPILKRDPAPKVQFQPKSKGIGEDVCGAMTGGHQRRRVFSEGNSNKPNVNAPPPESRHDRFMEPQHRFKLTEELMLVSPFDASNPRDYMAFRAQWKNFETKMVQSGRSKEDLYDALLKVLKGAARDLCKNKYHDPGAYNWAMQQLEKIYNKPENLLREMITNLLKTNKMVDTYESLLSGVTKLREAWRDLNQADLREEELKGLLFIAASEKNLSDGGWKCWLDVQNSHTGDPLSIFEVSTYIGAIEMALANAQKGREVGRSSSVADHKNKPKPKQRSTVFGSYNAITPNAPNQNTSKFPPQQQARTAAGKCVFCKEMPHRYQLWCSGLKNMSPDEVWKTMRENKIFCQMCLGLGHNQKECEATKGGRLKKCNIKNDKGEVCSKLHCKFLHQHPKKGATSNNQTEQ